MGKPKIAPPKPQAPPPTEVDTAPSEEVAVKKQRRQRGYSSTLLTGALTPNTGKKTTLGG